jgi:hypothetical protein
MSNSGEPEPQSRHGNPIEPSLYLDGALRLVYEVAALVIVRFASGDWVNFGERRRVCSTVVCLSVFGYGAEPGAKDARGDLYPKPAPANPSQRTPELARGVRRVARRHRDFLQRRHDREKEKRAMGRRLDEMRRKVQRPSVLIPRFVGNGLPEHRGDPGRADVVPWARSAEKKVPR